MDDEALDESDDPLDDEPFEELLESDELEEVELDELLERLSFL